MAKELILQDALTRPDLLAIPTLAEIGLIKQSIQVAQIDPNLMKGEDFCRSYGVDPADGANCVIMKASRGAREWFVAALVPVGCRLDIGGDVRRLVDARRLSVAPLEKVLSATQMEYGSITVVGLPSGWIRLVDARLVQRDRVFLGSGVVQSKLCAPGVMFTDATQYTIVENLGINSGQG